MKTGIESLDTGASKITYEGDEGPRSPQQKENEMFQMAMKSGLIDEYRNYKMEMENAGQPVLSIREYFKMMYDASRIGAKEGGAMQLVKPNKDGSRPGYRGDAAAKSSGAADSGRVGGSDVGESSTSSDPQDDGPDDRGSPMQNQVQSMVRLGFTPKEIRRFTNPNVLDKIQSSRFNNPITRGILRTGLYALNPSLGALDFRKAMQIKELYDYTTDQINNPVSEEDLTLGYADGGRIGAKEGGAMRVGFVMGGRKGDTGQASQSESKAAGEGNNKDDDKGVPEDVRRGGGIDSIRVSDSFKDDKKQEEEKENIIEKFLSNVAYNTKKNFYDLTHNPPINELGFISLLTQEQIEDLDDDEITEAYNKLSSVGVPSQIGGYETVDEVAEDVGKFSFDSFEKLRDPNLTTGDDMNFAEYAAKYKGAPSMLKSGNVGGLEIVKKPDGTYGYEKIRGEGGGGGNLPLIATGNTPGDGDPGDSDPGDSTIPTNRLPLVDLTNFFGSNPDMSSQYFYGADGGRPGYMGGGIADLRQGYFLGKLVKKATRGIKKIFKSPIGKAALIGGLAYFGGGGQFNKLGSLLKGGKLADTGFKAGNLFSLTKNPLISSDGEFSPFKAIGLTSLAPLLFSEDDDDKRDYRAEYDAEVQKYLDMYGPANFRRYAADGGRMGFAVGGYDDDDDDKDVRSSALNQLYGINRLRRSLGGSTGLPPVTQAVDGISTQSFGDDETPEPMQTTPDQMPKPRMMNPMMNRQMNPMMMRMQPRMMAQEGGMMDMGGMEKDYRNEGGFVAIGGKERADDVPARLSKNEFVFTADAVRNAGGGDIDKGAEIMENMMGHLEQGGEVSKESQGLKGARQMFATSQRLEEVL